MTWSNLPDNGARQSPTDAERAAWERGGTTLFPAGKLADRITTMLLLAFGAVMTIVTAVVGLIAVISATAGCDAAQGCSPGGYIGGTALAVGGSFVIGVASVVLAIGAWIRRRTSWWIAAVGFVLALACITWGGALFAQAADSGDASVSTSQGTA